MLHILRNRSFPELKLIEKLIDEIHPALEVQDIGPVIFKERHYPIHVIRNKNYSTKKGTLLVVGGVHGLERIGTHVALSYLNTVNNLLHWDQGIHDLLEHCNVVFVPLLNPVGMHLHRRSNGNRVDLNRNAPIDSKDIPFWQFFSGHRMTPRLGFYRGESGTIELENELFWNYLKEHVFPCPNIISIDLHSGVGLRDHLWFPYAYSKKYYPFAGHVYRLKSQLAQVYPYHVYTIEPQSVNYLTHGDMWDYLSQMHQAEYPEGVFIPLTLEMGSWRWIKKSPLQLLYLLGMYNPLKEHRYRRVMRRHLLLFDYLLRATANPSSWVPQTEEDFRVAKELATTTWYEKMDGLF